MESCQEAVHSRDHIVEVDSSRRIEVVEDSQEVGMETGRGFEVVDQAGEVADQDGKSSVKYDRQSNCSIQLSHNASSVGVIVRRKATENIHSVLRFRNRSVIYIRNVSS